ncbi:MAG: hypothetical protein LUO93_11555 [Methanomicrobiales archaeon]|nr:hypothetical protein [Methanomicrobiales archaeon]
MTASRMQWWQGHYPETDWKAGFPVRIYFRDGSIDFIGTIQEYVPFQKIAIDDMQKQWNEEYGNQHPTFSNLSTGWYDSRLPFYQLQRWSIW